jgi:hypothetical protein
MPVVTGEGADTRAYHKLGLNTPARERASIGWGAAEGATVGAPDGDEPQSAGPGEGATGAELSDVWPCAGGLGGTDADEADAAVAAAPKPEDRAITGSC